jgi:alpha-tubulin suppressor-like RCC1 family protein
LTYGAKFVNCSKGERISRGLTCEIACIEPYYYTVQNSSDTTYDCVLGELHEPDLVCKSVCQEYPIVDNAFDLGHCRWTKSDSSCKLICKDGYSAVEPEGALMYCYNGSWDYGVYEGMSSPDWCRRECSIPGRLGNGVKFQFGTESYCVAGTSEMPSAGTCDVECNTFFIQTMETDEVTNISRSYISCTEGLYIDHTIKCTFVLSYYITGGMEYPVDGYILIVFSITLIFCVIPVLIQCIRVRVDTMSLNSIDGVTALIEGNEKWIRKCIESNQVRQNHSIWNFLNPCCCCYISNSTVRDVSAAKRVVTEQIRDMEWKQSVMFMSTEKCLTVYSVSKRSSQGHKGEEGKGKEENKWWYSSTLGFCLRICRGKSKVHSRVSLLGHTKKKKTTILRRTKTIPSYSASPLHIAVFYSHVNIVKMFIEMGASVKTKDSENHDVIKYAETTSLIVSGHLKPSESEKIDPHLTVRLQRARRVLEMIQNSARMSIDDISLSNTTSSFRGHAQISPISEGIEMVTVGSDDDDDDDDGAKKKNTKRKMYKCTCNVWSFGSSAEGQLGIETQAQIESGMSLQTANISSFSSCTIPVLVGEFCELPSMVLNDNDGISRSEALSRFFRDMTTKTVSSHYHDESCVKYLNLSVGMTRTLLSLTTQAPILSVKEEGFLEGIYEWGRSPSTRRSRGKIDFIPTHLKHQVFISKHRNSRCMTLQVISGAEHFLALVLEFGPVKRHYQKKSGHRYFVAKKEEEGDDDKYWYKTKVVAWGRNDGRLGTDSNKDLFSAPPTEIHDTLFDCRRFEDTQIVSIESGTRHSAAIDSEGKLYMWGVSTNGRCATAGQFRNGMLVHPTWVSSLRGWYVHQVSLGDSHSMAIASRGKSKNQIFVWGRNSHGCLGLGDEKDRSVPTSLKDINDKFNGFVVCCAAGGSHSMALVRYLDSNSTKLFSWGANMDGQLGIMSQNKFDKNRSVSYETRPRRVHSYDGNTNSFLKFIYVVAGYKHSIGIVENDYCEKGTSVYVWGANECGQLGTGNTFSCPVPTRLKIFDSRTILKCLSDELIQNLFPTYVSHAAKVDPRYVISTGKYNTTVITRLRNSDTTTKK